MDQLVQKIKDIIQNGNPWEAVKLLRTEEGMSLESNTYWQLQADIDKKLNYNKSGFYLYDDISL